MSALLLLQGRQKKKESFGGACMAIINILRGDFGSVRVDFAKPFSVQVRDAFFSHILAIACMHMQHNLLLYWWFCFVLLGELRCSF